MYYKNVLAQMVDDDVIRFSEKGMLFLGFFYDFLGFFLRFCLQTGFFQKCNH